MSCFDALIRDIWRSLLYASYKTSNWPATSLVRTIILMVCVCVSVVFEVSFLCVLVSIAFQSTDPLNSAGVFSQTLGVPAWVWYLYARRWARVFR